MVDIVGSFLERRGRTITALYPRQSGKSEAVAMALFYLIVLSAAGGTPWPLKAGVVAPSEGQALLLARKVKGKLALMAPELRQRGIIPIKDLERWLEYPGGTLLKALPGNKTAHIVGESFNLIIIDEAQDIEDQVKSDRIDPMGAHYNALKVYMGTPGYTPNFFYTALGDSTLKHYITNTDDVVKHNPQYGLYLERQRAELGPDSPAYRRQYGLEWLFDIGQPITPRDIAAMQERGPPEALTYSEAPAWVGLDLAKYDDSTVATVVIEDSEGRPFIASWVELRQIGYEAQLQELLSLFGRFPFIQSITADTTGAGDPVIEWFKSARPDIPFKPFIFSMPGKDALYKEHLRAIEDRRLLLPQSAPDIAITPRALSLQQSLKRFISQNITLQREVKGQYMSIHHRPGGNDDYPDSAALALWGYLNRAPEPTATIIKTHRAPPTLGARGDKFSI